MPIYKWTEKYSVNIREIDEQHKKLIEIVNSLYDAMSKGEGREALNKVFDSLIEYTEYHFSTEEKYLRDYEYPDYSSHKREHAAFAAQILEYKKNFEHGDSSLAIDVIELLFNWMGKHFLNVDKRYSDFLNSKGVT